jgi:5,10-methylenetetrahydromethanopterin reductase
MEQGFRSYGISVSNEGPLEETARLARACQAANIPSFWIPESYHYRSLPAAATLVAAQTQDLGIGMGVVNPYTRHPALIAMEAASIDEISHGRVTLGLGAALFTVRKYGADPRIRHPLQAMREAVDIVQSLLAGQAAPSGDVFRFSEPVRLGFRPLRPCIPIVIGAVNARMLELAGEKADGAYLGALTTPGYVRFAKRCVERGLARAGRKSEACPLLANVLLSVDADGEAAREAIPRELVASYVLRVEAVVREHAGVSDRELQTLSAEFEKGGLHAAAQVVSDKLVSTLAVAGTPKECGGALSRFVQSGLDVPLAWHVLGPRPLEAIPLIKGVMKELLTSEPSKWLA